MSTTGGQDTYATAFYRAFSMTMKAYLREIPHFPITAPALAAQDDTTRFYLEGKSINTAKQMKISTFNAKDAQKDPQFLNLWHLIEAESNIPILLAVEPFFNKKLSAGTGIMVQ